MRAVCGLISGRMAAARIKWCRGARHGLAPTRAWLKAAVGRTETGLDAVHGHAKEALRRIIMSEEDDRGDKAQVRITSRPKVDHQVCGGVLVNLCRRLAWLDDSPGPAVIAPTACPMAGVRAAGNAYRGRIGTIAVDMIWRGLMVSTVSDRMLA